MTKTIEEINAKIQSGTVAVFTAKEIIDVVREKGPAERRFLQYRLLSA
ncbi:MAG: hypothetical protein JRE28_01470 [Deltaproteobacteria bacterium]|nr:hypothetical protein [Deltaproteobacteria bacterium]